MGLSKFTRYTAGISVPEIMLRVNLIINMNELTLCIYIYIIHSQKPYLEYI